MTVFPKAWSVYGRAAAAKGIENDIAALRNIENRVADHGEGFDGRMKVKTACAPAARKGIHARIVPDVRSVTPVLAKLDVVDPRCVAFAKHEHQFVTRTIKRSHAPVGLDPHAKVQKLAAERSDRAD